MCLLIEFVTVAASGPNLVFGITKPAGPVSLAGCHTGTCEIDVDEPETKNFARKGANEYACAMHVGGRPQRLIDGITKPPSPGEEAAPTPRRTPESLGT